MKKIIVTLVILGMAAASPATIINIPADYPTIQQGIDAGTDGDTVLVQPGMYYENINFNGHNIVLGSLYLTTGDTSYIEQTVIDGDFGWTGAPLVSFSSGEDSTAIITGFAIQNSYSLDCVGGIYCDSSSPSIRYNIIRDNDVLIFAAGIQCGNYSNPIISNNIIMNNSSTMSNISGGIHCTGHSNPIIMENIISENYGDVGGGISSFGNSNPEILYNRITNNGTFMFGGGICLFSGGIIIGNEIIDNTAAYFGGGICSYSQDEIIIYNNTIINNSAMDQINGYGGGGIACINSSPLIEGNVIYGNYAYTAGGGIGCRDNSNPRIINNAIYGNIADSVGGGLFSFDSYPTLINNIFWADSIGWPDPIEANEIFADSGSPTVEYCNIQGGWPGTGNIDVDPLFRNPEAGDFHLMAMICGDSLDSPCIDAGSPYYSDSLLDCSWGLGTSASDMGAYGGGDTAFVNIFNSPSSPPDRFMLLQNYPNPFNAQTTIRFILTKSQDIELTVYDLLGRRVKILFDEYKEAGVHAVTFDASRLSSGVYFYRLEAGDAVETKRMVLLK
ncbi:MAG: right-handed parallel beta-helix repeat-containing protein [Candidatus Zixiibacteriota bacterium]|nr:MAG: right-handed parallel beta-helix repeat-containing protein [candidate division Zixibacteria bacterium]